MKKLFTTLLLISVTAVSFSQEVRDHRNGNKPTPQVNTPAKPPPVAGSHQAGPPATAIVPGKWYYIRHAGTEKYMMISGHKDLSRSMACLAIEEMQQDNASQQWRFVAADENGSTIYKLQNRKYIGDLHTTVVELYMEFRRDKNKADNSSFLMVLNPDKSWYMLTRLSGNNRALSSVIKNSRHCKNYHDEPVIGGRVITDFECINTVRREFVTSQTIFTGKSDQKWILEEVTER